MWPERGEALSRTIEAEQAIEDLYAEALRRWSPQLSAAVLPRLAAVTAAADDPQAPPQQQTLPPDPAAVAQTTDGWSLATEAVIITGIGLLWSAAVIEAMYALGIPLPEIQGERTGPGEFTWVDPVFDPAVMRIVDSAVGDMNSDEVIHAHLTVEASPALRETRNAFLDEQRARAAETPAIVQAKVESAVRFTNGGLPATVEMHREAASAAIDPAGPTVRDIARNQGYQAASVLNHAVMTAAEQQNEEFGEQLQKCWIATLDGKTRPTHWAADGQRVPLSGSFTVGGEQMLYPADPAASPAETANCRCRLGILAADEALPDEVDRHTERLDGRDSVAINRDGRTQAEEIERRRQAGNVRARDDLDGIGRVAAVTSEQEMDMDVIGGPTEAELSAFEPDPDFAGAISALVAANQVDDEPRLRAYDPRLFEDPKLTGPTAPTMNNETGRIYGHLAEWGHVIRGGRDMTPRNRNGYRNFHTSQIPLINGKQLSVGRLTVQGGHASTERGVTAAAARAHYDDVTTAFGLVRVGEDRFGIWFSGVPAPGVDPDVFQQGMTAALSGDWRDLQGAPLDMIAVHAVNSPGFPIYSAQTGPDGRELALVASLGPVRRTATPGQPLTVDDVKVALTEVLADAEQASALAARRHAALTAAHALIGDPPEPPEPPTPAEQITALVAAHSAMPAQFKKFWLHGAGSKQINFGTPGDFDRCRKLINAKIVEHGQAPLPPHEIAGLCASLHREATGATPGHAPGEKHA